ncbi:MAG: SRPBCC family protein [bacterium]
MNKTDFVYTTYIKTTPEKLWQAITHPEFTRQYWGHDNVSDWKKGSEWKHVDQKSGQARIIGKVIESNPPKQLVLSWADPADPADDSQVVFEIDAIEDMVCLTVTHGRFKDGSKMPEKITVGWPRVLSSLKSYLESGKALNTWAGLHTDCTK